MPGSFLDAFEQAVHERRPVKGIGLVHHRDRGSRYLSIRYTERLADAGIEPSVGSVDDSHDNALAETIKDLFKAGVIHCRGPCRSLTAVEYARLERVDRFNNVRGFSRTDGVHPLTLPEPIGNIPPAEAEADLYATLETDAMAAQPRSISLRQTRRGTHTRPLAFAPATRSKSMLRDMTRPLGSTAGPGAPARCPLGLAPTAPVRRRFGSSGRRQGAPLPLPNGNMPAMAGPSPAFHSAFGRPVVCVMGVGTSLDRLGALGRHLD